MVQNQKTPLQHNLTLFILPQLANRRQNVFITPPNPQHNLFESPGNSLLSLYNLENSSHNLGPGRDDEEPLSRADKLRLWRHDALLQHHYTTAEFIGNKVLSLTKDPNDAFWLGQVYFSSGAYLRAQHLLSRPEFELLLSCRYLCAYSLIKLERWDDALDLLGETNPFKDNPDKTKNTDGGVQIEASMCYLRGLIYVNQNNYEKAKEAYKEAVLVDVKCYEAFHELISGELLSPSEEWEFITQLNYKDADDNDELVKLLYTTCLSKYMNILTFEEAEGILKDEYRLGEDADLLRARADYLYTQCNYDECLKVCEEVLERDPYNFEVLPNYLSCLYELKGRNKLFLKAHQMAEEHPTNPLTWLAIGIYYMSINKVMEARKFFSKATMLNPNNGQAWIGFAHTFALEGEHEQAISAYAFASRLFPGSHLPNLFLGMQHLQTNNINLADEYLLASYQICRTDPLLLNEMGVICYNKGNYKKAEANLQEALGAAKFLNSESKTWVSIHQNLGHVHRRTGHLHKALDCFFQASKISHEKDVNVLSLMGLVLLNLGQTQDAIGVLHEALAISSTDLIAVDLLNRALEISLQKESRNFHDGYGPKISPLSQRVEMNSDMPTSRRDINDVTSLAEKLKRGADSSDDEEIMDMVSD